MAASKPTGVHYALIIFVMLTLIFGVMAFMFGRQISDNTALLTQAQKQEGETKTALNKALEQVSTLKTLTGHSFDVVVNTADPKAAGTVSGAAIADIALAGEPAQTSMSAAIRMMAEKVRQLSAERDARQKELDTTNATLLALQNEYQKKVDEEVAARGTAETTLQNRIQSIDEELKVKDDLIAQLEKEKLELSSLYDAEQVAHSTDVRDRDRTVQNLTAINSDLQQEIDKTRQISFEVADGKIVSIDNTTRTAYINLGKADDLPLRTSFSVYTKANSGVARGKEDIKGAIEVTQHIGPHLSIVRITGDDIYNPIAPGDPIYTPMWHVGQKNSFAFVGSIDLDGDGQSDRELLHELVESHGALIDNEVDDEGNLKGDGISIKTRFLVMGDVPVDAPSSPIKRAIYDKIKEHQKNLAAQARERGVRVVTLDNFLNFIGYRPSYFVYKPGVEREAGFLKGGSVSTRSDGTTTRRLGDSQQQLKGMDRRDKPNVKKIPVPGERVFGK